MRSSSAPSRASQFLSTPTSSAPPRPLVARALTRTIDGRAVIESVDLTAAPGARVGLIGENGAGKSTLLRLLAGVDPADSGTVDAPGPVGYLPQEVTAHPDATVGSLIEDARAPLRALEHRLEAAALALAAPRASDAAGPDDPADTYARALAEAEAVDFWTADARRDALLDGFGVAHLDPRSPLDAVSGGQRSRFALVALLWARPATVLLDEPTNHLDDAAVALLTSELRGWRGPVVFASHDRAFLDEVATELVDLDPTRRRATGENGGGMVTRYGGGFSDYLVERALERERWEQRAATEKREERRLRDAAATGARSLDRADRAPRDNDKFIVHFKGARSDAATRRRVRDAEQRLAAFERDRVGAPPDALTFAGIPPGSTAPADSELVALHAARVAGRLASTTLALSGDARLLITGANGAGKSTLLALLAGTLPPTEGRRTSRRGMRVATLAQDVRFADAAATPRALYVDAVGARRAEALPLTRLGLIAPRDVDRAVGALSIGQQRRLALALIIAKPPHLFLLDEPTNHLSLQLAGELEEALGTYPGAVVVASHDRWLRSRWEGRVFRL